MWYVHRIWDNDVILDAGAVTWGDGNAGVHGVVSRDNSLVGTLAGDMVGEVTALDDGNYVVRSPLWNNGNIRDAGAANPGAMGQRASAVRSTATIAWSAHGI